MIKAWLEMWKNIFNFKGCTTRKNYWLALLANTIVMYIMIVPVGLILKNFSVETDDTMATAITVIHCGFFALPVISMYFRRSTDIGLKAGWAIYYAIVLPAISFIVIGVQRANSVTPRFSAYKKILALGLGAGLYASIFNNVSEKISQILPLAGILLMTAVLIVFRIKEKVYSRNSDDN